MEDSSAEGLVKDSIWPLIGRVVVALLQMLVFLVLTRRLGSSEFGRYMAVFSIAAMLYPFCGFGCSNILIRDVCQRHISVQDAWGRNIISNLVAGGVLVILGWMLLLLVLSKFVDVGVAVPILLAELVIIPLIADYSSIAQAQCDYVAVGNLAISQNIGRIIGAVFLFFGPKDLRVFCWGTFGGLFLVYIAWFLYYAGKCGLPTWNCLRMPNWTDGIYFSIGQASKTIYSDMGKPLLARFVSLDVSGVFSAASRIVSIGLIPVQSVMLAAYSRFFGVGNRERHVLESFRRQVASRAWPIGLVSSLGVFGMAGFVPNLLGGEYQNAVVSIRLLAVLPFLQSLYSTYGDAVTGAGFQRLRSLIQLSMVGIALVLNLILLPKWGSIGAILVVIVSECLIGLSYYMIYVYFVQKRRSCAAGA